MNLIVQIYLVFFQSLKEQVFLGIVQVKSGVWFGRYYCEKSWNKNLMKSFKYIGILQTLQQRTLALQFFRTGEVFTK